MIYALSLFTAESKGFEPPVQLPDYTAFRVRPIRPLWQLSKATAKLQTI